MPKIVDVEEKRREILAAAIATFAEHGLRETSLARVARAAGMGKSSLYHYFPTREDLFTAIADEILLHEADLFRSLAARPGPPRERLRALVLGITALFAQWAAVGPLLIDFLTHHEGRDRLRRTLDVARDAIAEILREGQHTGDFRAGSPDALATIVLACLDGLFLQELIDPGRHPSTPPEWPLLEVLERGVLAPKR